MFKENLTIGKKKKKKKPDSEISKYCGPNNACKNAVLCKHYAAEKYSFHVHRDLKQSSG